jgi:hypothetical protein
VGRENGRREGREGAVEIVADVVLDALRAADDGEAGAEPGEPVDRREQQDDQRVAADGRRRGVGLQGLDGALDRPRDAQARQRGDEQAAGAERVAGAVTGEVPPDRARCRRQRAPSANGVSAA